MSRRTAAAAVLCLLFLGACADESGPAASEAVPNAASGQGDQGAGGGGSEKVSEGDKEDPAPEKPEKVDPRKQGFEITLGEWAVTPEAPALRPGRVTFVIHNRGTMPHGFEIELEGESSGHGSGDIFKAESELLDPGESTRMTVTLAEGVHKIECLVDGHDDMGMEGPLEVSKDAALVKEKGNEDRSDDQVAIADFGFAPASVTVPVGTEVTWRNDDPTQHTVTADGGAFDSDILDPGGRFAFAFEKVGVFQYVCNIHPNMKGTVKVE